MFANTPQEKSSRWWTIRKDAALGALFLALACSWSAPTTAQQRPTLDEARDTCQRLRKFAVGGGKEAFKTGPTRLFLPFPDGSEFDLGDVVAYEEHRHFTYVVIDLSKVFAVPQDAKPATAPKVLRRIIHLKPALLIIDDQVKTHAGAEQVRWGLVAGNLLKIADQRFALGDQGRVLTGETLLPKKATLERMENHLDVIAPVLAGQARLVHLLHLRDAAVEDRPTAELDSTDKGLKLAIRFADRVHRLSLPAGRIGPGDLEIVQADGQAVLGRRLLPSGVMPSGPDGVKMLERWDKAYQGGGKPGWDTGRPSGELKKLIEEGLLKPGRVVDLGCGAGTNAIYLASKGFEVTGIDVAPTGLNQAQERAQKAGVQVRWLLADVLAPPDLEPFDLIFDRGCYHHLRRINPAGYVETLRRYTRPGSRALILAGNANEKPHWGPPRVKEEELRGDFNKLFEFERLREIHFDAVDPNAAKRALAWSVLLKRK